MAGRKRSSAVVAGLLALAAACSGASSARAAVQVAILPASQQVAPGAEFDVTIQVTNASPAFNGFHFVVAYDPNALTAMPLSPLKNQIGSLMTSACGNQFHQFHYGNGADTADVALLCSNVSVSGPGTIYKLHFKASNTVQATGLSFVGTPEFANAGIYLLGVSGQGAIIGIGMAPPAAGVGDDSFQPRLRLSAGPNPAHGGALLAVAGVHPGSGAVLRIVDTQGRAVRTLALAAGAGSQWWDGRDERGVPAAPGVYLVEARVGEQRAYSRVVLTH